MLIGCWYGSCCCMLHFFNFIPRVSLFLFFKSQNLLFPSPTPFCLLLPFLFHFIFDFFPLLAWFSSLILIIYSPSILSKTFFPFRYFIIFFLSFFLLIPFISLLIFPHLSFILQGWIQKEKTVANIRLCWDEFHHGLLHYFTYFFFLLQHGFLTFCLFLQVCSYYFTIFLNFKSYILLPFHLLHFSFFLPLILLNLIFSLSTPCFYSILLQFLLPASQNHFSCH